MAVGHGQFGLRSGMRTSAQHRAESFAESAAFIELEGRATIQDTWTPTGGAAGFEYAWEQDLDGELFDVATVRTLGGLNFTRAEDQAALEATELKWQYDMDEGVLRLHLPSDADPSDQIILVTTCTNHCTGGTVRAHMVQPYLGADQIVDGHFDESGIPDWNPASAGSFVDPDRVATPLIGGGYSCAFTGTGIGSATIEQQPTSANGRRRRVFGYYQTAADLPATASFNIRVGTSTFLADNGLTDDGASVGLPLEPTFGRTRAFVFDLWSHEADVTIRFVLSNSGATASSALLDCVTSQPIHGWRYFHPRVAADGVPESEQGSQDIYPGSASTGGGSVRFLNDDAQTFERLFSGTPWSCQNGDLRIRYGGTFADDGQEILWNDMFLGQSGVLAGDRYESVSDEMAVYTFEDPSSIFGAMLPSITYGEAGDLGGDIAEEDRSRPRARFFGPQSHIRPARIDSDGTTGLGIYEVNDPNYAIADAYDPGLTVKAYASPEAAEADDATQRVILQDGLEYDEDPATGRLEILRNPGVFMITRGQGPENEGANDYIEFIADGSTCKAILTPGPYTSHTLSQHVEEEMEDVAPTATFAVVYDNTTHKWNIAWTGAGNFELLVENATNRERSALPMMGFTDDTDYTGATDYDSDTAVFTDPDLQNFIRVDAEAGYMDDADTTYTGTGGGLGSPLLLGPDIFRYALHVMLGEPTSRVDLRSFEEARVNCPQILGVYLGVIASISGQEGGAITFQDFKDRLEVSGSSDSAGIADIRLGGDGVWRWSNRAVLNDEQVQLHDRDFLPPFEGSKNGNEVYGIVRVIYGQDPSTGRTRSNVIQNNTTILRDGRPHDRNFKSFLTDQSDAEDAGNPLGYLARAAPRRFAIHTFGTLLDADPGRRVALTRARGMQGPGETGGLDAIEFRILWLRKNFHTREVLGEVVTNVTS